MTDIHMQLEGNRGAKAPRSFVQALAHRVHAATLGALTRRTHVAVALAVSCSVLAPVQAATADATAVPAPAIAPADAQRALEVLQDDHKRAEAVRVLSAIANSVPAGKDGPSTAAGSPNTASAAPTPSATAPAASSTATPAASSATAPAAAAGGGASGAAGASTPATIVPLEENGLTARMLRSVSAWVDGLGEQLEEIRGVVTTMPQSLASMSTLLADRTSRSIALRAVAVLIAVFGIGLALEWGLRRLLRNARLAIRARAAREDVYERETQAHATPSVPTAPLDQDAARADPAANLPSRQAATGPDAAPNLLRHDAAGPDSAPNLLRQDAAGPDAAANLPLEQNAAGSGAAANQQAGALRPPSGVAIVVAQRDGKEHVEAVPVAQQDAAAPPPDIEPAAPPHAGARTRSLLSRTHVHALRRIPYAVAALLLDLIPLVLFCIAAALVLRALAAHTPHVHAVIEGFLQAYVTTRVIMALLRLLVYPDARALRMLQVQDDTAQTLQLWVRRIVVLAAFGLAFCDAVLILGAGEAVRLALLKAISLIVHIMAVVLVWRMQRPVADAIRAPAERGGSIAAMRFWLANSWAVLATVFIMGAWVVWALGVADGFPKLVHFIAESVGVIILARLIAVFALGAVERLFMPRGKRHPHGDAGTVAADAENEAGPQSDRRLLNPRYYASVRWLVSLVICVGALVALMQSWGFDAVSWFAPGTLGGGLASAAGTILVAIALAVLVWEVANARIENRLRRWQAQGDMVRAARLRTLLPMLRTALLVIVILVVGLTALNQIGINTTPLLAGASIVGVALGFGSQKLVQDFITGIFLLMENAMQVGDWVTVAGVSGSVEYLSIRTVRLRGGDGSLNIVPFSSVSTVNNVNRGLGNAAMRVSLGYGVDVQTVLDELKKIGADLRQDPAFKDVILADMEVWGVDAVDGSMWTVAGQIRCTDKGRWGVQREINRRVLERFRELGIEIANPRSSLLMLPQEPSGHEGPPVPPRSGEKTDGAGDCHQK